MGLNDERIAVTTTSTWPEGEVTEDSVRDGISIIMLRQIKQGRDDLKRSVRLLRESRIWFKITQVRLADCSGVSASAIQKIEAGAKPRLETLERLYDAMVILLFSKESR